MLQHGNQVLKKSRRNLKGTSSCFWCGCELNAENPATVDHIVPLSRGGDQRPENKSLCCHDCNQEKKSQTKFRGRNVYKLVGIKKPQYVSAAEDCLKHLLKMQSFARFYRELSPGEKEFIENTIIERLKKSLDNSRAESYNRTL